MNVFSRLANWIIDVETDFVRLICTIIPWLVPLIPAWLIYNHAINQLLYPKWVSNVMGIVVEGLGLASLVTSFQFWSHNRKYKDTKTHFPLWVPIATYVFYLVVVLSVNVILDIKSGIDWTRVLVVALFSLLSLPAGALLSVQTLYNEWVTERSQATADRRQQRLQDRLLRRGQDAPQLPAPKEKHAGDYKEYVMGLLDQHQGNLALTEITRLVNKAKRVDLEHNHVKGTWYKFVQEWKLSHGVQ